MIGETFLKKVSIIVPVYNGSKFIKKTLSNIFTQTYGNIELILVNDGSTDDSLEIITSLSRKAPVSINVKIINQDNSGIAKTRNRGIEEATGDYICFMDQDDGIYRNYISTLVKLIEESNSDILIGGYNLVDGNGRILDKWILKPEKKYSTFRITAPWGRIFRKNIIDKHNIRFMDTKVSEDFYFNVLYLSYCNNIKVTSYSGYRWLYNENSESHANWSQISDERNPLIMLTQLQKDINKNNELDYDCLEYMQLKHLVWYLLYVAKSASKEQLKKTYDEFFKWLDKYYPNYKKNKIMKNPVKYGESFKIGSIVNIAIGLKKIRCFYPMLRIYSKII